jgi:hypothetical protein
MDEVPFLDSNTMGNADFNAPIDPALHSSSEFPTSGLAFVTVPEQSAETSSRILVHFVQILEAAETAEGQNEGIPSEPTFTAEELEALEPIVEEDPKPNLPSIINGICVNIHPRSKEIKEVIDFRRIRPHHQTFYLAKTVNGDYYWFHTPYAACGRCLQKLIGDYRRKLRKEAKGRKTSDIQKRLRKGKSQA